MAGANNWRPNITAQDWMRSMEKRVLNEERRPLIRSAADLLGPGFAPYAVQVTDWDGDEAVFNGMFYSTAGLSINSPDNGSDWIGMVLAEADGFGIQRVMEHRSDNAETPIREYMRRFFDPGGGGTRAYSAWQPMHPVVESLASLVGSTAGTVQYLQAATIRQNLTVMNWRLTWTAATLTGSSSGNVTDTVIIEGIPAEYRTIENSAFGAFQVGGVSFGTCYINNMGEIGIQTLHATGAIVSGDTVSGTIAYSQLL